MPRSEKDTRIELIDPALRRAGWKVLSDKCIIEKNAACIETPVVGMPKTTENPTGNGFVDYVLFGDDGNPLGLVEAKKSVVNEEQGRVQACLYADCLERQYGVRPVVYYTNGYSIKIIDGVYPAREIFGFHKKDELEYLIQRRNNGVVDKHVDPNICQRYYQVDAIDEILKHLGSKHSRSLIVLATGTGKTRVSCAISDIFLRNNFVKRILFLADRKNLVLQAKEETFEKFLPSIPMAAIIEGRREPNEAQARIVFSTYQSMISIIRDTSTCPYGIGHFDLIIVDAYGIIGLNSKGSANKGFLKLSPILFSPQMRLMIDLRRKHAQNEDLSAKRSAACNSGSTVSDVVPSRLLQRQSAEHTPDVDLHRSTVRYSKDVSFACAA